MVLANDLGTTATGTCRRGYRDFPSGPVADSAFPMHGARVRFLAGELDSINGPEFEQAPGVGDGQESLACYSTWVAKSQI